MSCLQPLSISSTGGLRLAGFLHRPTTDRRDLGVIVAHGMLSSMASEKHTAICEAVAARGHTALRFDFRGRGESEGDPHELTVSNEIEDMQAAIAFVRGLGLGRITLVGSSLGGTVALLAAAADQDIAGLVTIAAPSRLPGRPREGWGGSRLIGDGGLVEVAPGELIHRSFFIDATRHDPIGAATGIDCPWLIIHGDEDSVVPPDDARLLHEASPTAALDLRPTADHRFSSPIEQERLVRRVAEFLSTVDPVER